MAALGPLVLPLFILQMVGLALNLPLVLVLVFSQSVQREALTLNLIILIGVASPILHSLTRFSSSSSWDEAPDRSICVTEAAFASSFKLAVPAVMLSLLVKTLVSLFAATRKRSDPSSTFAFKAPLVALPYLFLLPSLTASLVVGRRDAYAALEVSALGCAISDQRLSLALDSLSVALLSVGFLVLPVLGILLFQRYVYARRLPPSAQATLAKYSVGRWLCVRSALATLSFAAFFVSSVLLVSRGREDARYAMQATAPILTFLVFGVEEEYILFWRSACSFGTTRTRSPHSSFSSSDPHSSRSHQPKFHTVPLPEKSVPTSSKRTSETVSSTSRTLLTPTPSCSWSADDSGLRVSQDLKRVMRDTADVETYARESPSGHDDSLRHFPTLAYLYSQGRETPSPPSPPRRPQRYFVRPPTPSFL